MTICLGKSCSFDLPCVYFVYLCQVLCLLLSLFGVEGGIRDMVALIPDHCLSFYFTIKW